jgi:hypothetical protein
MSYEDLMLCFSYAPNISNGKILIPDINEIKKDETNCNHELTKLYTEKIGCRKKDKK